MGVRLTGAELLPVLLELQRAPPNTHRSELYQTWRDVLCTAQNWTTEEFEDRLERGRNQTRTRPGG